MLIIIKDCIFCVQSFSFLRKIESGLLKLFHSSRPLIKSILLKGKWKNVSDNDEVVIKQENGNTRLTATCIDGRPVEFKLIAQ